jgi:hypothetical protein
MTDGEPATSPTVPEAGGISGAVEHGVKQTREAGKWLIGAFATIGGVLVAGSQLSDMGNLAAWSARWWAAVGGLGTALIGILAASFGTLWILLPSRSTLSDAAADNSFTRWVDKHPELLPPGETSVERFRRTYLNVHREYDEAADAYEEANAAGNVPQAVKIRWRQASARWAEIKPWGTIVNDAATDRRFRRAALTGFTIISVSGTLAAAGIVTFAWAAHPEKDEATTEAVAATPAAPARVRLALTASGEKILREATGCDPTKLAALRIGGDAATPDVLVLPAPGCKTVRLTLSDSAGEAVESG